MKKLLASLLFLPFLAGANAGPVTTIGHAAGLVPGYHSAATGSISSIRAPATQPSLPGHLSAGVFTVPIALLETGSADTWRTPTRSGRSHTDPLHHGARAAETRTHIHTLQRSMLEFGHTLARVRANEPATFGNPPPASRT
jgi:hypothetical protein